MFIGLLLKSVDTRNMRIVNLVENEIGKTKCEAAHGLSFYVESENHKLLFDTSPSDLLLQNAKMLGVDLTKVDTVILSHGHYDHSGGMMAFCAVNHDARIYMQRLSLGEYYAFDGVDKGFRYIGTDKRIRSLPNVVLLDGDVRIDDELCLFTVDKRVFPLPSANNRLKELRSGEYVADDFRHEQNLLLSLDGKKILFCGCAHNGILNVLHSLEEKFSVLPDAVIGGFHLMKKSGLGDSDIAEIKEIAERLKAYKTHFFTCHCTGLDAFSLMKEILGDNLSYVHSGDEVEL
jgi:7,8-dihydropterin-6-yl-methyl-4-(beta-D-ribofuranosyl)aminobenzene 5'-phosphate synthase